MLVVRLRLLLISSIVCQHAVWSNSIPEVPPTGLDDDDAPPAAPPSVMLSEGGGASQGAANTGRRRRATRPKSPGASGRQRQLRDAVVAGDLPLVRTILEQGREDADGGLVDGGSSLGLAAAYGHVEILKLLLEAGANVNNQGNRHGQTPLLRAVTGIITSEMFVNTGARHLVGVQLLLEAGADVDVANFEGLTPLMCASGCSQGQPSSCEHQLEMLALLLEHGARTDLEAHGGGWRGKNALSCAIKKDALCATRSAELLLDSGADIDAQSVHGYTALFAAVASNDVEAAQMLVDRGARTDLRAYTAIEMASKHEWPYVPPTKRIPDTPGLRIYYDPETREPMPDGGDVLSFLASLNDTPERRQAAKAIRKAIQSRKQQRRAGSASDTNEKTTSRIADRGRARVKEKSSQGGSPEAESVAVLVVAALVAMVAVHRLVSRS